MHFPTGLGIRLELGIRRVSGETRSPPGRGENLESYGPQLGRWTAKLGGWQGTAGRGCYVFGGQPFEPREQYRGAGALQPPANRVGEGPYAHPPVLGCVLACGILTAITVGQTHGVLTKAPYAIEKTRSRLADGAFVRARGAALSETGGGLGSAAGAVHIPAGVGE
ncbi:hypothetical protein DFH09DRAFT_1105049 [Mycena vulgaris]|nr:hypothetical protein DFH09DRAFT_1105049 [Mycena vulgaris]